MPAQLHCPHCGHLVPLPVPDVSLTQLLLNELEQSNDADAATNAAIQDLPHNAAAFVRPSVNQTAKHLHRTKVRGEEKTILGSVELWRLRDARAQQRVLTMTFSLGDSIRIPWLQATIEQHRQRIAMLAKHIDGTQATINRHLRAIDQILATPGATCLADVLDNQ